MAPAGAVRRDDPTVKRNANTAVHRKFIIISFLTERLVCSETSMPATCMRRYSNRNTRFGTMPNSAAVIGMEMDSGICYAASFERRFVAG